ncbi:MAG: ABC transporter permease [Clostridiales bacterium]|nr:ABC transporter permease [Clostridiales bacterium]
MVEGVLPPVNEAKRFFKVFFKRKIVVVCTILILIFLALAIFQKQIAPYDPNEQNLQNFLQPPSSEHLLGTDALGRDLFSRIIYGTRIAMIVGVAAVIVSAVIGTLLGLIAGFMEGIIGTIIMRLNDALMAIPHLILTLMIAQILQSGVPGIVIAISISLFPGYIRLAYGQVLSLKQNDYVLAARSMGAKKFRIILRHLLPNTLSPLIVRMTMMIGTAILAEAGLSFLGLGIKPPTPAWGSMCYDGYKYLLTRPLLSLAPGFVIMLLVLSFNMVGDGLRDAIDPRMRGTSTS